MASFPFSICIPGRSTAAADFPTRKAILFELLCLIHTSSSPSSAKKRGYMKQSLYPCELRSLEDHEISQFSLSESWCQFLSSSWAVPNGVLFRGLKFSCWGMCLCWSPPIDSVAFNISLMGQVPRLHVRKCQSCGISVSHSESQKRN